MENQAGQREPVPGKPSEPKIARWLIALAIAATIGYYVLSASVAIGELTGERPASNDRIGAEPEPTAPPAK